MLYAEMNSEKNYIASSHTGWMFYSYKNDMSDIMQFTGLHDKNGKEIWEGDVVKVTQMGSMDAFNHVGEIRFYSNSWCVDFVTKSRGGWCKEIKGVFNCKVIGNIYENHELLENSK